MPERKEKLNFGEVEVIVGPMFSGKTDELIRRLNRALIAKEKVQLFKPIIDDRYAGVYKASSHNGATFPATPLELDETRQILEFVRPDTQIVAIDEAQFFPYDIIDVVDQLAAQGKRVIVAGLAADFRDEPFGAMPALMAKAEKVTKLSAICKVCDPDSRNKDASFTQRFVNGKPANYNDPVVIVGADEMYEARCRRHHEVPGRPNK
jgi:thymidine kinase